jgi:hypothetical protein
VDNKLRIIVEVEQRDDGRTGISVGQVQHEDVKLSFGDMAMILGGAIVMLSRLSEKECGIKDYELMESVIANMNKEFVSFESFDDARLFEKNKSPLK